MIDPDNPEIILVPTYNGTAFPDDVESGAKPEYTAPLTPVTLAYDNGLRLVLGGAGLDADKPDIQVERQPGKWVIFIHPESGCDPSGYLYIMDDGRSFVQLEHAFGKEALEVLQPGDKVPE